ncbi:U-box domain-containing protein 4 [Camellia sinensis]|uniref:U-box domain-containing protein 4 n=1 Tax=Camellia sinensis TaxID=4442 RepID=UPI00103649F8|nr:U-box domain-containing protein 4 [Camellia sinensis]
MEEAAVVEGLLCGDGQRQILAAKRVCKATSKQRHKLAERVVAPLVMMLHPRQQQQVQDYDTIEAALFALLSLASGSEQNKIHIVKSGAVPALLKLLHCQIESLFNLVIAALLILSSCTANKLAIAASGAIQLLIEFLNSEYTNDNNHQDNNNNNNIIISIQAKLDIIATLHNLSTYHQTIPSIVLSGVVVSLVQLICGYEKSSELVDKAMALLERIVSSSESALTEAASTGGTIQALVEALEEGSPLCKENAVGILVLICQSCRERYRGMILREGVMPGLLQLSVDGTWRAKEMARALLLLLRDCSSHHHGSSRNKQWKNVLLERAMEQIDADERVGTALRLVEETIAKLSA